VGRGGLQSSVGPILRLDEVTLSIFALDLAADRSETACVKKSSSDFVGHSEDPVNP